MNYGMTNALYVNVLAMTWYFCLLLSANRLQGLKPLQGFGVPSLPIVWWYHYSCIRGNYLK
jgi:hypothetical protein